MNMLRSSVGPLALLVALVACQAEPPAEVAPPKAATASASASKAAAKPEGEVVFDPNNPPPGWVTCHRNHCHHKDGRVASYAQVMQEIGATKMVGGGEPKAMPPAPADVAAPPADAEKLPSGLVSKVQKEGTTSQRPGPTDVVVVHYTGWTTDGKPFDSSVARGQPAQVPVGRVMPGWTEGLQLMNVGEERRFWIPEALAYKGVAGKPKGMLVFDVELIAVQ